MNKIFLIIRREFMQMVAKKSFIISTILMPLFMLAMCLIPSAIMMFSGPSQLKLLVVDESGQLKPLLRSDDNISFVITTEGLEKAKQDETADGVLFIPSDGIQKPDLITLYTREASGMQTEETINSIISRAVEQRRLASYDIKDLDKIIADVQVDAHLRTVRLDKEQEDTVQSGMASYFIGIMLAMLLYFFVMLYGNTVMNSIIEEKNNRVLELVVTSVRPMQILLGKILGVACVAMLQMVIWMVLLTAISAFVIPAVMPADLLSAAASGDMSGAAYDADLVSIVKSVSSVGFIVGSMFVVLLFLVGGCLLYSALFAMIGSAVDTAQDAAQLQWFVSLPLICGIIMSMVAASNPTSALAIACSYIPFTSPMVMMARMPYGVPGWELAVSVLVLYASFVAAVWISGKVYRVGIFMHGKKPTARDLLTWMRQS